MEQGLPGRGWGVGAADELNLELITHDMTAIKRKIKCNFLSNAVYIFILCV